GISAFPARCESYAEGSLALVTALNTHIGYLNAAAIAKESLETGKPLRQLVLEHDLMDADTLNEVLDLKKMSKIIKK
ncbi:MAG: aspartate ammonia-lyase, partial [Cyanobacteria bacterium J06623_5]